MVNFDDFKKLEIKTAKIVDAQDHPNADRLFILQVDVGGEKKQMIAGIKGKYSKEELVGKDVVAVNNLEPVVIRGEKSEGMVLAATSEDSLVLIVPDKEISNGSTVK